MRIRHLETSLEINADVSDEHLQALQTLVQRVLDEVKENSSARTPLEQAIIALYHIADNCVKLEQQCSRVSDQLAQTAKITESMLINISDIV